MKGKLLSVRIVGLLYALLLLFVVIIGGGQGIMSAFAAGTQYTSVIEDLQKDPYFDAAAYPDDEKDYSIKVIQIAESTEGELFIYTHQPAQKTQYLIATEVNMALSESVVGTRQYKLTLLSSSGVLCKYKVNGVKASKAEIRYYNITSIYRKWIPGIDAGTGTNATLDGVAFDVGHLYVAKTENGSTIYKFPQRTIKIINPYFGFLRYTSGYKWYKSACDSHYVAFTTDLEIEDLKAAELEYVACPYEGPNGFCFPVGDSTEYHVVLTDDEKYHEDAKWWISLRGQSADYDRIETVSTFLKEENNLLDSTKKALKDLKWVLRFSETDYTYRKTPLSDTYTEKYTYVSEVAILRLKYETDGVTYDLGAVANKGSEAINTPGNREPTFWEWIAQKIGIPVWALTLLAILIPLLIILPILGAIFPTFGAILLKIVKAIFKALWWIISWPFKKIAEAVRKRKAKKKRKTAAKKKTGTKGKATRSTSGKKSTKAGAT